MTSHSSYRCARWPEKLRDLFDSIRADGESDSNAAIDNDPTRDDWTSARPARRSRRRSGFDVA
jgi:hypothetical protein